MDYLKELQKVQHNQQGSQVKDASDAFVVAPATELVFTDLSATSKHAPRLQRSQTIWSDDSESSRPPHIKKTSYRQTSLILIGLALLVAVFCLPFAASFIVAAWDGHTFYPMPAAITFIFFWPALVLLFWSFKVFSRRRESESPFQRFPSIGLAIVTPLIVLGLGFGAQVLLPRGLDAGRWLGTEQKYAAVGAQVATETATDAASPAATEAAVMDAAKPAVPGLWVKKTIDKDSDEDIITVKPGDRSPNEANAQGQTAVHKAVQQNDPKTLHKLLLLGGRGDIGDHQGTTALHLAVRESPQILPQLLQAMTSGAQSLDQRDSRGQTALMLAISSGNSRAVDLLIMASANTHLKNREGLNAQELAKKLGHADIANQLVR